MKQNLKNVKTRIFIGLLLGGFSIFSGCGNPNEDGSLGQIDSISKRQDGQIVLNGAGATFPSPIYSSWTYSYTEQSNNRVLVNYQGIGSGAGINQLSEETIDFAGTDAPLTDKELQEKDFSQFPMLSGGIVLIVNVPGVTENQLRLSKKSLAGIWLGEIKKWNDPLIATDNPQLKLPDLNITVVHRSDGSGTTFLFTNYLSSISPEWKDKVGRGKTVNWPVGIGGQKNPGVCNNVARIKGSIGYTEFTYASGNNQPMAVLENNAGKFVAPEEKSFTETLKNVHWNPEDGFCTVFTDIPGEASYPILGTTCVLFRNKMKDSVKKELFRYFLWCFVDGKSSALRMHYIPIPDEVVKQIINSYGMDSRDNNKTITKTNIQDSPAVKK